MRHHLRLSWGFAARHPLWNIFDSVSLVSGIKLPFFQNYKTNLSFSWPGCRFPSIADGVIFRLWRPQLRFGDAHRVKVQWVKSGDAAEMEPWVREWYSYNGIVWVNMFRVGSLEAGVMMRSFQDCQKCEVQDFECQVCFALWALKERWDLVRV